VRLQERLIERFLTQMPFAPREDLLYLYERLDRDSKARRWAKPAIAGPADGEIFPAKAA